LSLRSSLLISALAALAVLAAGISYAVLAPKDYRSTGALVLAPSPTDPSDLTSLLNSFERSGTMGSFVELIASDDLRMQAGNPPVDVSVRPIPDTRVIQVTTTGDRDTVAPALTAVLSAAQRSQGTLRDPWDLSELESASAPEPSGLPLPIVLAGTLIAALISALVVFTVCRRLVTAVREALAADDRSRFVARREEDEDRAVSLRRRAVG